MKRSTLLSFITLLSILGLGDSWYLADTALTGGQLTCTIEGLDGCNTVAQSVYAHLFGLPLGVYGVAFYALILVFVTIATYKPSHHVDGLLALLAALGTLASLAFLFIQFFLIKAVCIYCLGSAVISFLLAVGVYFLYHRLPKPDTSGAPAPTA